MVKQKNSKTDEKIKVIPELLNSETNIAGRINDIAADKMATKVGQELAEGLLGSIDEKENVGGTQEEGNGGKMMDEGGPITTPDALTLEQKQDIVASIGDGTHRELPPDNSSSQQKCEWTDNKENDWKLVKADQPVVVNLPDPDKLLRRDVVKAVESEPVRNNGGKAAFVGTNSKGKASGRSVNIHSARPDRGIKNV